MVRPLHSTAPGEPGDRYDEDSRRLGLPGTQPQPPEQPPAPYFLTVEEKQWLRRKCPTCGAKPWRPCVEGGQAGVHPDRVPATQDNTL